MQDDLTIARAAELRPITEIAESIGIEADERAVRLADPLHRVDVGARGARCGRQAQCAGERGDAAERRN